MPTVLRVGPYRVMIYTHDHPPAHVHVVRDGRVVKLEIGAEVRVIYYHPKMKSELSKIREIITEHQSFLLGKWVELHGEETDSDDE